MYLKEDRLADENITVVNMTKELMKSPFVQLIIKGFVLWLIDIKKFNKSTKTDKDSLYVLKKYHALENVRSNYSWYNNKIIPALDKNNNILSTDSYLLVQLKDGEFKPFHDLVTFDSLLDLDFLIKDILSGKVAVK